MGSMSGWGSLPDSVEVESWQAEERPLAAGERRPRRRIGRRGGGHILFGGRMQEGEGGPLTRTDRMRERLPPGLNVDSSPSTPPTYRYPPSFVPSRDIAPSSLLLQYF